MYYFYSFLLGLCNAFLCAHYAKRRGRNPFNWFIGGAFFGLLALATLFLLPRKRALVVASTPKPPLLEPLSLSHVGKLWYYLDREKKQQGPMSLEALSKAFFSGEIEEKTYVWNEAMDSWKHLADLLRNCAGL